MCFCSQCMSAEQSQVARTCFRFMRWIVQGLQAPAPVDHSPNDQVWRDEELARAVQVIMPLNNCHDAFCDGFYQNDISCPFMPCQC